MQESLQKKLTSVEGQSYLAKMMSPSPIPKAFIKKHPKPSYYPASCLSMTGFTAEDLRDYGELSMQTGGDFIKFINRDQDEPVYVH